MALAVQCPFHGQKPIFSKVPWPGNGLDSHMATSRKPNFSNIRCQLIYASRFKFYCVPTHLIKHFVFPCFTQLVSGISRHSSRSFIKRYQFNFQIPQVPILLQQLTQTSLCRIRRLSALVRRIRQENSLIPSMPYSIKLQFAFPPLSLVPVLNMSIHVPEHTSVLLFYT